MKSAWSYFENLDLFGRRIQFTHEGRDKFKTSFGAMVSLIFTIGMLGYLAVNLQKVWSNQIESLSSQLRFYDPNLNQELYDPFEYGFRFAVGFKSELDDSIG